MNLELTDAEARVLRDLLDSTLGDLSSEIADTDNVHYRGTLNEQRDQLRHVREQLG